MAKEPNSKYSVDVSERIFTLLSRFAEIDGRQIPEIVDSLLQPALEKYSSNTLEEWEEIREKEEMEQLLNEFQADNSFDPNRIPFDRQILGLRRKLDELAREIQQSSEQRPDLEKLRFSLLEELNFAEKEALEKQNNERNEKSRCWREACRKYPL